MTCPLCESTATTERADRTELGYRRFHCRVCMREFNERTRTLFSRLQYPTDVVCLVVLWRFRYKLSLWDLAEMSLQCGLAFTFEAVQAWEAKLAPLLAETLPKRRYGTAGKSWSVDETMCRCKGAGALGTVPSTPMGISSMRGSAIQGTSPQPRRSSAPPRG